MIKTENLIYFQKESLICTNAYTISNGSGKQLIIEMYNYQDFFKCLDTNLKKKSKSSNSFDKWGSPILLLVYNKYWTIKMADMNNKITLIRAPDENDSFQHLITISRHKRQQTSPPRAISIRHKHHHSPPTTVTHNIIKILQFAK